MAKPGRKRGTPKTGGRAKGTPNKVTGDLREMVRQALELKGGVKYLVWAAENEPRAFLALVGRCVPLEVKGADGGPLLVLRDLSGPPPPKVIEGEVVKEKNG